MIELIKTVATAVNTINNIRNAIEYLGGNDSGCDNSGSYEVSHSHSYYEPQREVIIEREQQPQQLFQQTPQPVININLTVNVYKDGEKIEVIK